MHEIEVPHVVYRENGSMVCLSTRYWHESAAVQHLMLASRSFSTLSLMQRWRAACPSTTPLHASWMMYCRPTAVSIRHRNRVQTWFPSHSQFQMARKDWESGGHSLVCRSGDAVFPDLKGSAPLPLQGACRTGLRGIGLAHPAHHGGMSHSAWATVGTKGGKWQGGEALGGCG